MSDLTFVGYVNMMCALNDLQLVALQWWTWTYHNVYWTERMVNFKQEARTLVSVEFTDCSQHNAEQVQVKKNPKCRKTANYSNCSWFQSTSNSLCIMLTWKHQMGASCETEHLFVVEHVFMQMIFVVKAPWCRVVLFTFTFSPKD